MTAETEEANQNTLTNERGKLRLGEEERSSTMERGNKRVRACLRQPSPSVAHKEEKTLAEQYSFLLGDLQCELKFVVVNSPFGRALTTRLIPFWWVRLYEPGPKQVVQLVFKASKQEWALHIGVVTNKIGVILQKQELPEANSLFLVIWQVSHSTR